VHEYSIVSSLLDRVQRESAAHPHAIVRSVHVRIGELAGVELPLLRTAYATFRERSVCVTAELEIEPVAARWECPRCQQAIAPGAILRCAACDRAAHLVAGGEIMLDRIELELPDV